MRIDQRNAAASVTASGAYALDRWVPHENTDGTYTVQQVTTAPTGYTNSLKATVTLADTSIGASQNALIAQYIEGYNVADLGYGTATAQTVTLSFWVNSSLTGTFTGALNNSAYDRSYPFTYTISVANTWEQKSVTIAGDTSGTWLTTNGVGIRVWFALAAGSSVITTAGAWAAGTFYGATGQANWMATLSNTFYLTGVQFEVGTVATSFERQIFSNQLAQCQRYYYFLGGETPYQNINTVIWYTATECVGQFSYPVTMRGVPTVSKTGNWTGLGNGTAGNSINADQINTKNLQLGALGGSGGTFGYGTILRGNNDTSLRVTFSAEL